MKDVSEIIAEEQYAEYVALLVFAMVVILILLAVVVVQSRKIRDLKQPKYGFLGKPLNVMFVATVALSGFGIYYYIANQAPTEDVTVSADKQIDVSISTVPLGESLYRLSVTPYVDGVEWGKEGTKFNVYWTITTGSITISDIELEISRAKQSGITKSLEKGLSTIKADVFVGDDHAQKTITININ